MAIDPDVQVLLDALEARIASAQSVDLTDLENRVAALEIIVQTVVHPDEIIEVYQVSGTETRITYRKV